MKLGSAVTFMILSFIALGYLLSDNFNTREELVQIEQENQTLFQEAAALQAERDAALEALDASEEKVRALAQSNQGLQRQIRDLTGENAGLKLENSTLRSQAKASAAIRSFRDAPLTWAILFPLLPMSFAASYGVIHYSRNRGRRLQTKRAKAYVQLTEEEINRVIRMRRAG